MPLENDITIMNQAQSFNYYLNLFSTQKTPEAAAKIYRGACMKNHPDRGGNEIIMRGVTRAYRQFKQRGVFSFSGTSTKPTYNYPYEEFDFEPSPTDTDFMTIRKKAGLREESLNHPSALYEAMARIRGKPTNYEIRWHLVRMREVYLWKLKHPHLASKSDEEVREVIDAARRKIQDEIKAAKAAKKTAKKAAKKAAKAAAKAA